MRSDREDESLEHLEPIRRVAVLGMGTMGRNIATLCASRGLEVSVFDSRPDSVDALPRGTEIRMASSPEESVRKADLVVEAIVEVAEAKLELLSRVSAVTDATIVSNTSTFMPSLLEPAVQRPERFLVAHFFNPAHIVPLVEIVRGPSTEESHVERVRALLLALDKHPVLLGKEIPGFVGNRLQAAILREALFLIEAEVVTPEGIDEVVRMGLAPRWKVAGPIGVADHGGLDIFKAVCDQLFPSLENRVDAPEMLVRMVAEGHLGSKSGEGFYMHDPESTAALSEAMRTAFNK